jgi:hypothetical protein
MCGVSYDKAAQAIIRHIKFVPNLEIRTSDTAKKTVAALRPFVPTLTSNLPFGVEHRRSVPFET